MQGNAIEALWITQEMNTCPLDLLKQECWLKTLRLIYDTLYTLAPAKAAETQHTWWSASPNQTLEGKGCLHCMSENGWGPLRNPNWRGNVNGCMVKGLQRFAPRQIPSFHHPKYLNLCFWFMCYLIKKKKIYNQGVFKSHNKIRTTSKNKTAW